MNGFLLDENLPHRLTFSPSRPVTPSTALGVSPSDTALWQYARQHSQVIVTKDADFSHRMMVSLPPPWVVHLRFGNMGGKDFHSLLAKVWPEIEALLPSHKLICVYRDRIESFQN